MVRRGLAGRHLDARHNFCQSLAMVYGVAPDLIEAVHQRGRFFFFAVCY